ncbi:MAG: hypothetical protein O3C21_06370 [Verrucomicrobia bacterium]|nr:hypothetical protein [Verrucomicrobiota bacterium]
MTEVRFQQVDRSAPPEASCQQHSDDALVTKLYRFRCPECDAIQELGLHGWFDEPERREWACTECAAPLHLAQKQPRLTQALTLAYFLLFLLIQSHLHLKDRDLVPVALLLGAWILGLIIQKTAACPTVRTLKKHDETVID